MGPLPNPVSNPASNAASNPEPLRKRIARLAEECGFAAAGIAAVPEPGSEEDRQERARFAGWIEAGHAGTMEYLKRRDEEGRLVRASVRVAFPWARSVIVCAARYDSPTPRSVDPAPPGTGWIARYAITGQPAQGRSGEGGRPGEPGEPGDEAVSAPAPASRPSDYHRVLLRQLESLRERLSGDLGGDFGPIESRCFVDTGPVVERVYARYAGLGWIGKNTCLLSESLGSWLFLGVIVNSLEVTEAAGNGEVAGAPGRAPALPPDRCGSCTRCIDACPTGALTPHQMDATRCIAYLTIENRGPIPEALRPGIGRQVFGCDICQDVCPWNGHARRGRAPTDPALAPRPELVNPALEWLAAMNEDEYGRWFNGSPVRRTKFSGLRRNLAIAMGNSGQPGLLPTLEEWAADTDPVLAEAAQWAVRNLRRG